MSWGSTAFTPLITYNHPPFGFHESIQPSDYPTCPENPYSASEELKKDIKGVFDLQQAPKCQEGFIGNLFDKNSYMDPQFFIITIVMALLLFYFMGFNY